MKLNALVVFDVIAILHNCSIRKNEGAAIKWPGKPSRPPGVWGITKHMLAHNALQHDPCFLT